MKLTLLLLLGLTLLVTGLALTEEDNDFADFEYDVEGDQSDDIEQKVEQKVPVKNQGEQFMEVDLDDGLVEDEFDQDEFEGFGGSDDGPQEPLDKKKEPKLTMAKVPIHFRNWDSFYIEMLFLAGLVVYFVNYALGKNKNIKIANSWLQAHKTFLEDNFALVGDDGKKETEVSQTGVMVKESDSIFTLWCSGRVCCEGMLVELKLIKRQDLLALTMGILSSKVQDQVVIKTEMSKDSMDSFVFAVASKKSASKLFKDMPDLKQYCVSVTKPNEKYGLPVGFSVLSELAESSSAMLDARVIAMLEKYSDIIEYIHISDQFTGPQQEAEQQTKPETKRMLIVSFNLKGVTDAEMEELKPLLQLVIYLIDKLKRFKLSREGRAKTEKNRQAVEQEYLKSLHAVRQEAAAQKNSEKRKLEKEKLMAEENVEKQVRLEKKMKRKDAKKAQPKMKSMSIHL